MLNITAEQFFTVFVRAICIAAAIWVPIAVINMILVSFMYAMVAALISIGAVYATNHYTGYADKVGNAAEAGAAKLIGGLRGLRAKLGV